MADARGRLQKLQLCYFSFYFILSLERSSDTHSLLSVDVTENEPFMPAYDVRRTQEVSKLIPTIFNKFSLWSSFISPSIATI